MFTSKDPEETITITFDFSNITKEVFNPEIDVSVVSGTDENASDILYLAPQIYQRNKVLQRIISGVDIVDYQFRCKVTTANDDIIVHTETLPVRTAPYIG